MEKNPTQTQQNKQKKPLRDDLLEILSNSCYNSLLQKRKKTLIEYLYLPSCKEVLCFSPIAVHKTLVSCYLHN